MHQRFGAGYHSSTILENSVGSPGEEGMHSVHVQRLCCFLGENSTLQDVFPPPNTRILAIPVQDVKSWGRQSHSDRLSRCLTLGTSCLAWGRQVRQVSVLCGQSTPPPSGAPEGKRD